MLVHCPYVIGHAPHICAVCAIVAVMIGLMSSFRPCRNCIHLLCTTNVFLKRGPFRGIVGLRQLHSPTHHSGQRTARAPQAHDAVDAAGAGLRSPVSSTSPLSPRPPCHRTPPAQGWCSFPCPLFVYTFRPVSDLNERFSDYLFGFRSHTETDTTTRDRECNQRRVRLRVVGARARRYQCSELVFMTALRTTGRGSG